jgi:pyruvate dehydrogenase E2 component (dihydrolipoamide acetyltransferase)
MPALSPTMETGSIAAWKVDVGGSFAAGDALCAIETDKASVDFEAQDDGVLARILVPTGQDVPIGTPICVVVDDVSDVAAFADYQVSSTPTTAAALVVPEPALSSPNTSTSVPPPSTAAHSSNSLLFPSARFLAESHGKDATVLAGTGKGGRVTKADVQAALSSLPELPKVAAPAMVAAVAPTAAAPAATPAMSVDDFVVDYITDPNATYHDVPNNKMRKIIATRLTASKRDVPHFYVSMEIALDNVLKLRKVWQKQNDIKISVNDFILKAAALALRDVPQVNQSYDPKTDRIQSHAASDISVAVATPTGLITPIVVAAEQRGLADVSRTVAALAARARDGQLQPHEYQGGTFSLSNLGMYGIQEFAAVINPPQAAILAVGGGTPTLCPHPEDDTAEPVLRSIMTARLSADGRVVDEPTAARFLQVLRSYLETPELLLL